MEIETQEVTEIRELAIQFRDTQTETESLVKRGLRVAWKLGDALGKREDVLEQGEFAEILNVARIDKAQARKLIKLARSTPYDALGDSRQGMLALGIGAKRDRPDNADNGKAIILPHISASVAAWARYVRAVETKQVQPDYAEVRRETAEMFQWLTGIFRNRDQESP